MNELVIREDSFIAQLEADKQFIKETYCPGAREEEFRHFFHLCKLYRLNPFMKQIQYVQFGGKMTTIITIDGFRHIAQRTKRYAPGRDTEFVYGKDGKPISAKVYVKVLTDDGNWHEVSATALMAEYGSRKGRGPTWNELPSVMLEKCAESRAIRRAFSSETAGLYSAEELGIEVETKEKSEANETAKQQVTIDVKPKQAEQSEKKAMFGKTLAEYEELARDMWEMMQKQNPQLRAAMPYELPYWLEHCQKCLPNCDIRNRLQDWAVTYDRFLKGMEDWYEREGQYGYAQRPDEKDVG